MLVTGYEDGYDDLTPEQLAVVDIVLNTGKRRWEGRHGDPDGRNGAQVAEALVLRRVSN